MTRSLFAATGLALALSAGVADALDITPDIIFGSGNANGGFTVVNVPTAVGNIEIGLRAKLRFNDAGDPENTFNYDGIDTYTFETTAGTPPGLSVFNFEWSINSTGTGRTIQALLNSGARAQISYDTDPTLGVSQVDYDPLAFDAYYGTNATANGGGTYVPNTSPLGSSVPLAGATVAQNSVNYGFIPGAPLGKGTYNIGLSLFNFNDTPIGSTDITVSVVPGPATLPLMLSIFGGLGFVAARRRRLKAA